MKPNFTFFKTALVLICMATSVIGKAQTTGSFNTNITFMSASRQLSCYVPTNYNASNKYSLMVCLHGLGDNCSNYRDALINSLGWNTNIPNTIFICPEAVSTSSDFYSAAGTEAIVQKCIDYGKANYNIDTTNILLQGFSLGGRAALRYGLSHYQQFKGLVLNTPAMQGVKEGLNQNPLYHYQLENASKLPIYITHGGSDITYLASVDSIYRMLVINDGIVRKYIVPGLAHAIPAFVKMKDCISFINAPVSNTYDVGIEEIYDPIRTACTPSIHPLVLVQNKSKNKITSIEFQVFLDNNKSTNTFNNLNIGPYQHAFIQFDPSGTRNGDSPYLDLKILHLNGNIVDSVSANNQKRVYFQVALKGESLPSFEGIEENTFPANKWIARPAGDFYTAWTPDSTVKKIGAASMNTFSTILFFNTAGRREEMISPVLDFTTVSKPQLSFDVAYNYHKYDTKYFARDTFFADTLELLISTDCGVTYKSFYKKGGSQLATFKYPILNPINIQSCFTTPKDSNWRNERIDLSKYASNSSVSVKFSYISAMGGCINIDNIKFGQSTAGIAPVTAKAYQLYPNPATSHVTIIPGDDEIQRLEVMDISGKSIISLNGLNAAHEISVNTSTLQAGIYLFQVYTANGVNTNKVIINR